MFVMTEDWLWKYYGSHSPEQERQATEWLHQYGKDIPSDVTEWSRWKHLIEYQVNTNDIVDRCLDMVHRAYFSELQAHFQLNCMRVPAASNAYCQALDILEKDGIRSIVELGVGGDSAISTACFLNYLDMQDLPDPANPPILLSVDRNPLGMTAVRYKDVPFWKFFQVDSLVFLQECIDVTMRVDLVFIDTIHSYDHTLKELNMSMKITDNILMDDATFEGNDFDPRPGGVRRAIEEWLLFNPGWKRTDFADATVSLLQKR